MHIATKLLVINLVLTSALAQIACSSYRHDSNLNHLTNNTIYANQKVKDTVKSDSEYIAISNTKDKAKQNINSNFNVATSVQNNQQLITPNGIQNISLNDTIETIEKKIGTSLDVNGISEKCSEVSLNDLELLFKDNKLISIEVFTPNYSTDKLVKVGDSYNKLKSSYPDGKYQSVKSLEGDESYTHESRYFITTPNAKGNYYSFLLADNYEDVIQSFSINQIPFLEDNVCGI